MLFILVEKHNQKSWNNNGNQRALKECLYKTREVFNKHKK